MGLSTSDVQFIVCEEGSISVWHYAKTREAAQEIADERFLETGKEFTVETFEEFCKRERAHWFAQFPLCEITADFHDQMLNVLPPVYRQGAPGFFMCEYTSGTITNQFVACDGKFYAAAVDMAERATWIDRAKIEALPADAPRLEWFGRFEGVPA